MLDLSLKLRKKDQHYTLEIGRVFRGFFIGIALLMTGIQIAMMTVSIPPMLFLIFGIIGSLYYEHWDFDIKNKQIVYKYGLILFHKTTIYTAKSIRELRLSLVKGNPEKPLGKYRAMFQLRILTEKGEVDIDMARGLKKKERLVELAEFLSQETGIPFHNQ